MHGQNHIKFVSLDVAAYSPITSCVLSILCRSVISNRQPASLSGHTACSHIRTLAHLVKFCKRYYFSVSAGTSCFEKVTEREGRKIRSVKLHHPPCFFTSKCVLVVGLLSTIVLLVVGLLSTIALLVVGLLSTIVLLSLCLLSTIALLVVGLASTIVLLTVGLLNTIVLLVLGLLNTIVLQPCTMIPS